MSKTIAGKEVQAALFSFIQSGFIGEPPRGHATEGDLADVRSVLAEADSLTPADIAAWPAGRQLAVYELLRNALIFVSLRADAQFPAADLDGSSPQRLAQPLLSRIATVRDPIAG